MSPDLTKTISGIIVGLLLGGLITYGIHLILSDMQSQIKYIKRRMDDLDSAFLRFLVEFKELLLTEMEKREKLNQVAPKTKPTEDTQDEVEKD